MENQNLKNWNVNEENFQKLIYPYLATFLKMYSQELQEFFSENFVDTLSKSKIGSGANPETILNSMLIYFREKIKETKAQKMKDLFQLEKITMSKNSAIVVKDYYKIEKAHYHKILDATSETITVHLISKNSTDLDLAFQPDDKILYFDTQGNNITSNFQDYLDCYNTSLKNIFDENIKSKTLGIFEENTHKIYMPKTDLQWYSAESVYLHPALNFFEKDHIIRSMGYFHRFTLLVSNKDDFANKSNLSVDDVWNGCKPHCGNTGGGII